MHDEPAIKSCRAAGEFAKATGVRTMAMRPSSRLRRHERTKADALVTDGIAA
jgi:hypothetical protein